MGCDNATADAVMLVSRRPPRSRRVKFCKDPDLMETSIHDKWLDIVAQSRWGIFPQNDESLKNKFALRARKFHCTGAVSFIYFLFFWRLCGTEKDKPVKMFVH